MESIFPFGFPLWSVFYLMLFVLTFVLHQVLMQYVLGGILYVGWATAFPGPGTTPRCGLPLAMMIRDWMPFMLSAAITAGVAPLLFVQILYPHHFYTANLLLSWRWMMIIPVLIVAFYLLYLIKSEFLMRASYVVRLAIVVFAAGSFVFVGLAWTINHLTSLQEAQWPEIYQSGISVSVTTVVLRMLIWCSASFTGMAFVAGWQLAPSDNEEMVGEVRRVSTLCLAVLVIQLIAGAAYAVVSDEASRSLIFGQFSLPYVVVAVVGIAIQAWAWFKQRGLKSFSRGLLTIAGTGCILTLTAAAVVRESIRLSVVNIEELNQRNHDAAQIGGLWVFLIFAVVNILLIALCVRVVTRPT